jgi:uncharacterized protein with von Willebrand factor type A (vWA) domain
MIAGLARFVAELRREGIAASPAEWIDALRAVEHVGLDDRQRVRQALRATLVKRAPQLGTFDRTFERFFAPPGRGGSRRERDGRGSGGATGRPRGLAGSPAARPRRRRDDEPPPAAREVSRAARLPSAERLGRVVSSLREGAAHRSGRWRRVVLEAAARESRGREPGRAAAHREHPLRRELARRLTVEEEREIAAQVPRLVERIRLRTGRRLRRSAHGRPYLRRVFRDNLRHGGVPCVLPLRRLRRRRSRVVLLIDVSWSTARAAGLFLSIAGEFLRRSSDTRVLLFVDRAIDATREIEAWLERTPGRGAKDEQARSGRRPGAGVVRAGLSFARVLGSLRGLNPDAPSDYGRAFHALSRSRLRPGGRTTALLVLGDGRTNRFDAQDWAFEAIVSRCGAVVWLVPEPLERWGTGDSALGEYLTHVDVAVEARDLSGLARGVSELLRRL